MKSSVTGSFVEITYVSGTSKEGYPGVSVIDGNGVYCGFILNDSPYKVVFPDGEFKNVYREGTDRKARELVRRSRISRSRTGKSDVPFAAEAYPMTI